MKIYSKLKSAVLLFTISTGLMGCGLDDYGSSGNSPSTEFGADASLSEPVAHEPGTSSVTQAGETQPEIAPSLWGGGANLTGRWPNGIIPYVIDTSDVPAANLANWVSAVQGGVAQWNSQTVLVLVERTDESDYIHFKFNDEGDFFSCEIGYDSGEGAHSIHLAATQSSNLVAHEIGHAVGLKHEHQRDDRSDAVWVFRGNALRNKRDNFDLQGAWSGLFGFDWTEVGPYDLASVMQYGSWTFSNGFATMLATNMWSLSVDGAGYFTCRTDAGGYIELIRDTLVGDFDGDGKDDLLYHNGDDFYVSYSPGGTGTGNCGALQFLASGSGLSISDVAVGNFDNDSQADIFVADGTRWRTLRSSVGYTAQTLRNDTMRMKQLLLGDFNADGISDVIDVTATDVWVSYSGTGKLVRLNSNMSGLYSRVIVGDVVGDSRDDLVAVNTWPALPQQLMVSDGGSGTWTTFIGGSDWPFDPQRDFIRAQIVDNGGSKSVVIRIGANSRFEQWSPVNGWSPLPGAMLTSNDVFYKLGDFQGGPGVDILLQGWIAGGTPISPSDSINIETIYGGCSEVARQEYMTCSNGTPITPAIVSIIL